MKNTVLILTETHPLPVKSDDAAITQTVKAWLEKELRKGKISASACNS